MGHWTTDGASPNTTMMQAMEAHLTPRQIDYDAADNHIICIEHNTANTLTMMLRIIISSVSSTTPPILLDA